MFQIIQSDLMADFQPKISFIIVNYHLKSLCDRV